MSKKASKVPAHLDHGLDPGEPDPVGLERLVFFSDAVFAIAITLLALDIRLPVTEGVVTNEELLRSLVAIWPKYLGYIVSFLVIGSFWISHHRKFRYIRRYDSNLLTINLVLLMSVAFIPFPTSVISEYGNQTATIFYAVSIVVVGLLSVALWWYASYHNRLIDTTMDSHRRRRETLAPLVTSAIFFASIGLALVDDDLAKISWVLIAVVQPFIR